jgi:hypothetical protein
VLLRRDGVARLEPHEAEGGLEEQGLPRVPELLHDPPRPFQLRLRLVESTEEP